MKVVEIGSGTPRNRFTHIVVTSQRKASEINSSVRG